MCSSDLSRHFQLSQHIVLSVGLITDQGLAETGGNGVIFLFAIPEEMTAEIGRASCRERV